jgi:hypothetical protein
MHALKGFQGTVFHKVFTTLHKYQLFILKILTETLLRILEFSSANFSLAAKKCPRISLLQAASGMILQNHRRLHVSIFSVKISKEQSKTLSLIFPPTKKQIIVKTIIACT